ncbi:PREDICTED: Werner Syndrome-like exonuclease isoform X2 [Ipomoea nil]|nr:PREDICTED: Werner Syndrome-like exonuclease isoform X2 [Ipomoea nil]
MSRARLPKLAFRGRVIYSRTKDEVEKSAAELLHVIEEKTRQEESVALGFDTEWKPSFVKGVSPGKAAVIQICGDMDNCYVFHIFHSGISQSLQLLLENSTPKVGAGIAYDGGKVFKDHNVRLKGLKDLSALANQKLHGGPRKWGLASLTEKLLYKKLAKGNYIRLGDWETTSLSKEQLNYAATDAYTSWQLYHELKKLPDVDKESN